MRPPGTDSDCTIMLRETDHTVQIVQIVHTLRVVSVTDLRESPHIVSTDLHESPQIFSTDAKYSSNRLHRCKIFLKSPPPMQIYFFPSPNPTITQNEKLHWRSPEPTMGIPQLYNPKAVLFGNKRLPQPMPRERADLDSGSSPQGLFGQV
jgi:hypothetical protein